MVTVWLISAPDEQTPGWQVMFWCCNHCKEGTFFEKGRTVLFFQSNVDMVALSYHGKQGIYDVKSCGERLTLVMGPSPAWEGGTRGGVTMNGGIYE